MSKKDSGPKYPSQVDELNAIDKIFGKTLKLRDSLIKRDLKTDRDKIRTLDLKISICIKKRAKVTKGGSKVTKSHMFSCPSYSFNSTPSE